MFLPAADTVDVKAVGMLLAALAVAVAMVLKVYLEFRSKSNPPESETDKRIRDLWNWHRPNEDTGRQNWKTIPAKERECEAIARETLDGVARVERITSDTKDMVDDMHSRSTVTNPGRDLP